ncbi:MAG: methyltransferase domain-containing protein [Bacteriovoracaceae bacterium]|jgi:2-polyprenyl-3-methyl-5-hydroxy-6-metoxy-1,4-benzoquinol methylase|nr:methyltransferase domain-containing protein [Bacteriovoracaceae bacterium]
MSKMNKDPMHIYYELMLMNGASYVFQIAVKMGYLQAFSGGDKLSAKKISERLGYLETPSFFMLETLESLGIFEREKINKNPKEDLFSLSKVAAFLTGNYQNLSADYWEHLPTLLKEGTPYKKMDIVEESENEYQVQVKALEWMLTPTAAIAAKNYFSNNKKGISIIDVGAGSGVWSFSMLYEDPSSRVTLADWPAVLEVAKATALKNKISEKITTIEGNFHESTWPQDKFDVCTLGNVTHILTKEANQAIFKKIYNSLNKDGELLIFDVISEREDGHLARSLYKLGLCIRTVKGEVFLPDEMGPWLKAAGFKTFSFESLDIEPYSVGLFKAKK